MTEERVLLSELEALYRKQLQGYRRLAEFSQQEAELIHAGRFDQLLGLLKKKKKFADHIWVDDETVAQKQKDVVNFFGLEQFTIPALREQIGLLHGEEVDRLCQVIRDLAQQLEFLSKQEQNNEALLKEYSQWLKSKPVGVLAQQKKAQKTYGNG